MNRNFQLVSSKIMGSNPKQSRRRLIKQLGVGMVGAIATMMSDKLINHTSVNAVVPTLGYQILSFRTPTLDSRGMEIKFQKLSAKYVEIILPNQIPIKLVQIPKGIFQMGSSLDEEQREIDEGPVHQVTINEFLMGMYPVTQVQWKAVASLEINDIPLDAAPSYFQGDYFPVENISWIETMEFCARLSKYAKLNIKLPSEAQWEYAARATTISPFAIGATLTTDLANYNGYNYNYADGPYGIYRYSTNEVGIFPPNQFGLYDMHGNVWEWVLDSWHETYKNAPTDGSGWDDGQIGNHVERVLRGGSWYSHPKSCRSARRVKSRSDSRNYNMGFRIAVSLI